MSMSSRMRAIKVMPWLFRGVTEWCFCSYKKMVALSWVANYDCIGYYINVNDQWKLIKKNVQLLYSVNFISKFTYTMKQTITC